MKETCKADCENRIYRYGKHICIINKLLGNKDVNIGMTSLAYELVECLEKPKFGGTKPKINKDTNTFKHDDCPLEIKNDKA
ncbi:hypothetical protein KKE60_08025 [Patescibacteria group bacterium]|nr:hypothetical protein [Patescibacteria group bacterium]